MYDDGTGFINDDSSSQESQEDMENDQGVCMEVRYSKCQQAII